MSKSTMIKISTSEGDLGSFELQERVNNGKGHLVYHLQNQSFGDAYLVITRKKSAHPFCGTFLPDGMTIELRAMSDGAEVEIKSDLLKSESMEQGQIQEDLRINNDH